LLKYIIVYILDVNMELSAHLSAIGLSEKEAATYIAVLQLGLSTVKPIADRAKVKRTSIYNFIDKLVSLGLVSKTTIRGRNHFRALAPERLIELQEQRLNKLKAAMPLFQGIFNSSGQKPRVSYYEGPEQIRNIVEEEPRCKSEACYIWTGKDMMEMVGGEKGMVEVDRARMQKGVWIRVIRFREKDAPFRTSAHGAKFLREIRYGPKNMNFPVGVGIYDTGKVGFFGSYRERWGLMIESPEMTILMKNLFLLLWDRSTSAREGEG